jgi:hypothetical protein
VSVAHFTSQLEEMFLEKAHLKEHCAQFYSVSVYFLIPCSKKLVYVLGVIATVFIVCLRVFVFVSGCDDNKHRPR